MPGNPVPLTDLPAGRRAMIAAVPGDDPTVAGDLAALRLLPGEPIEVMEIIPLGGPVLVQTGGGVYALGRPLAGRIQVVPSSPGSGGASGRDGSPP